MHTFLDAIVEEAESKGEIPKFRCATTWYSNEDDDIPPMVMMPLRTNNCDLAVNSNALFGISSVLLQVGEKEAEVLFDDELKLLYEGMTDFLN